MLGCEADVFELMELSGCDLPLKVCASPTTIKVSLLWSWQKSVHVTCRLSAFESVKFLGAQHTGNL